MKKGGKEERQPPQPTHCARVLGVGSIGGPHRAGVPRWVPESRPLLPAVAQPPGPDGGQTAAGAARGGVPAAAHRGVGLGARLLLQGDRGSAPKRGCAGCGETGVHMGKLGWEVGSNGVGGGKLSWGEIETGEGETEALMGKPRPHT